MYSSRYSQNFFIVCLIFVLYVFYLMLRPFLVAVILGITMASLFHPNYSELRRRLGGRSTLSAAAMCSIITFLIIIPLLILFLSLANEFNSAYTAFRDQQGVWEEWMPGSEVPVLEAFWDLLGRYLDIEGLNFSLLLSSLVDWVARYLLDHYTSILGQVGSLVLNFLVMIFSMFFFLRDGDLLMKELKKLIPLAPAYEDMVFQKLRTVIYATFFGIFATGIAQGLVAGIIFLALGINNPVLWGTATAFLSLVPVVGTAAVWVPMSLYLIMSGSLLKGIILLVLGASVIGLVDNFVRPLIIEGKSEGMHLLLVFFALAGGLLLWGPAGLVLGPLVAALLVTFLEIYKIEFREELN